jgi:hypothetical protein
MRFLFGVIPIFAIALVVGVALAIACHFTSRVETKPVYHDVSIVVFLDFYGNIFCLLRQKFHVAASATSLCLFVAL